MDHSDSQTILPHTSAGALILLKGAGLAREFRPNVM